MAMQRSIPDSVRPSIIRRWALGHSAQGILDWIKETNPRRATPVQTSLSSVERLIAEMQRGDHRACDLATVRRLRLDAQECRDNLAHLHLTYMDLYEKADVVTKTQSKAEVALRIRLLDRAERIADRRLRMSGLTGAGATAFLLQNSSYILSEEKDLTKELTLEEWEVENEARNAAMEARKAAMEATRAQAALPVEPAVVEPAVVEAPVAASPAPVDPVPAPPPEAPSDEKSLRLDATKTADFKAIEAKGCQDELEWDDGADDEEEESELRRLDGVVMTLIKKLRPAENWEEVAKEIVTSDDPPEPEDVVKERLCKDDGTVCQGLSYKNGTYTLKFPSTSDGA